MMKNRFVFAGVLFLIGVSAQSECRPLRCGVSGAPDNYVATTTIWRRGVDSQALIRIQAQEAKAQAQERLFIEARTGTALGIKGAIKYGAQINQPDADGFTALHIAAQFNADIDVVRALLGFNANPLIQDKFGRLPYELAPMNSLVYDLLEAEALYWPQLK